MTQLPGSLALKCVLAERFMGHQGGPWADQVRAEARCLVRDNPENNPIPIKPETSSHVAEQFWARLPCRSLLERPFPMQSFALSARVSPQTVHFRGLDKIPGSGPGRGPRSCKSPSSVNIYRGSVFKQRS